MNKKQLSVRLNGKPIGILEQLLDGKLTFNYNNIAQQAISISMPIREQPYGQIACQAFFGGLLPESESAKKMIGKIYGVSPNNIFSLLNLIGADCAGAISFHAMDEPIQTQNFFPLEGKIISEDNLYEHIRALPKKPLFIGVEGLRLSLAGVHDKAAVCLIDNKIALATHGCPTTHILKPAVPEFEGIVENEYFCLKVAARVGLPVPAVEIRQIKDISFLLIERFDRKIQQQQIERIHQEDFCQALGVVSTKKYQNEGGPNFKQCFSLLDNTTQPAVDRNLLAAGLVFNFLIGNMDAHGKNFSLLYKTPSQISLAPFYDLICTRVYPALAAKMAMKIGSQYSAENILPRHWQQLCQEVNYSYPALVRLIKKQAELILQAAETERDSFIQASQKTQFIDKIIKILERNISRVVATVP